MFGCQVSAYCHPPEVLPVLCATHHIPEAGQIQYTYVINHATSLRADDLPKGSPLEMCYYLAALQEEGQLLSKVVKKRGIDDAMIKVPAMGCASISLPARGSICWQHQDKHDGVLLRLTPSRH